MSREKTGYVVNVDDMRYVYLLDKESGCVGKIDVTNKSQIFIDEVIQNWEVGILTNDNSHIIKEFLNE